MRRVTHLLLFLHFIFVFSDRNQDILDHAIEAAIQEVSNQYTYNFTLDSPLPMTLENSGGICPISISERLACCQPLDTRYLYEVKISNGGFEAYSESNPPQSAQTPRRILRQHGDSEQLPDIVSTIMREKHLFRVNLHKISGALPKERCKSYFNGTLHVNGRTTAHNVYHALGDNFMPLASQIIADYFLNPEYVHLPRMGLFGFNGHTTKEMDVPHLRLMNDVMTAGMKTMDQLEGMCFRRIIWGHGAHLLYFDSLVVLRRLAAAFTRSFALNYYNIPLPPEFASTNQGLSSATRRQLKDAQPLSGLRVVLYTRGNSGKGRTMQGEDRLLKSLSKAGAITILCCDFAHSSMETQISYAAHADVIIGVHGAALVHGLFMKPHGIIIELKTLYGFTSGLFQVVADSRLGYLGQVDVREYWVPGGHKAIDDSLIARAINIISTALSLRDQHIIGEYKCIDIPPKHDKVDCVVGPIVVNVSSIPNSLDHILGPKIGDVSQACAHTVLHDFRTTALKKEDNDLHCASCRKFSERRLFEGEYDYYMEMLVNE